jgi:hypothetical protein
MPKAAQKEPATRMLVELPEGLAQDLEFFCRAHFDAPRASVIRQAIAAFIRIHLEESPGLREKFKELHAELRTEIRGHRQRRPKRAINLRN